MKSKSKLLAAALVVTAATSLSCQADTNGSGQPASEPEPEPGANAQVASTPPEPFPAPASGSKWIGLNGVVVAVPSTWPVSESPCGSGTSGEVVYATRLGAGECPQLRRYTRVSLQPSVPASGIGTDGCDLSTDGACYRTTAFAEQRVSIQVIAAGQRDSLIPVDRILGTAMVLPGGWTTVPFAPSSTVEERVAALEQAGFEVRVERALSGNSPVVTSPAVGSPIRHGGAISIQPA